MWPWEHGAVGYLAYSLWSRGVRGRPPTDAAALVALVGSQVPDLVDKPLAWWLGVLPTGRSLAHSLAFAVPVVVAVAVLARLAGRAELGTAFGVGYLAHLPGDVLYPVALGEGPEVAFLFYPLVELRPDESPGAVAKVSEYLLDFLGFLGTPRGVLYLLGELGLLAAAVLLWVGDGRPGLAAFRRALPG